MENKNRKANNYTTPHKTFRMTKYRKNKNLLRSLENLYLSQDDTLLT